MGNESTDTRWAVIESDSGVVHVEPVGDCRPHVLCDACPCKPQWQEPGYLVHQAWDRRELLETMCKDTPDTHSDMPTGAEGN